MTGRGVGIPGHGTAHHPLGDPGPRLGRSVHPQQRARQARGRRGDRHGYARLRVGDLPVPQGRGPRPVREGAVDGGDLVGTALLTPFVPTVVAGALLTGFSGGLLGLYLRTPGMRKPGSLALAKDFWLVGVGLSILLRGLSGPRVSVAKAEKQAQKAARAGRKEARRAS